MNSFSPLPFYCLFLLFSRHTFLFLCCVWRGDSFFFLYFYQLLVTSRAMYNINTALGVTGNRRERELRAKLKQTYISDTLCSNRYKWNVYHGSMKSDYQRGLYYFMVKSFSYHVGNIIVVLRYNLIERCEAVWALSKSGFIIRYRSYIITKTTRN